jgi:hypothetical protein
MQNQQLQSQNLSIVGIEVFEKSVDINEDWEIQVNSSVKNSSLSDITLKLKIDIIEMPFGHSFGCCWSSGCLGSSIEDWNSPTTVVLPAMSELPPFTFVGHYYCHYKESGCFPGMGKLRYTFYNANDMSDYTTLYATFNFTNGNGIQESLCLPEMNTNCINGNILQLSPEINGHPYQYFIYGLDGVCYASGTFTEDIQVNLNSFSSGAYIYSVLNKSGIVVAKGKMLVN